MKHVLILALLSLSFFSLSQEKTNYNKDVYPLIKEGKYIEALPLLVKFLKEKPDHINANYWCAKILEIEGKKSSNPEQIQKAIEHYAFCFNNATELEMTMATAGRYPDVSGIESTERLNNFKVFLRAKYQECESLEVKLIQEKEYKKNDIEKTEVNNNSDSQVKKEAIVDRDFKSKIENTDSESHWFYGALSSIYVSMDYDQSDKDSYIVFSIWNQNKKHRISLPIKPGIFTKNVEGFFLNNSFFYSAHGSYLDVFDSALEDKFLKIFYITENVNSNGADKTISFFTGFEIVGDTTGIKEKNYLYQTKIERTDFINNIFKYADGTSFNGFVQIKNPMTNSFYLEGIFKDGNAVGKLLLDPMIPEIILLDNNQSFDRYYELEYSQSGKLVGFYSYYDNNKKGNYQLQFDELGRKTIGKSVDENGFETSVLTYKNGYVVKDEWFSNSNGKSLKTYQHPANLQPDTCLYCYQPKSIVDGTIVNEKKWYGNGQLKFQGATIHKKGISLDNDSPEGENIYYYPDGQIEHKFTYRNGKKIGLDIKYHKNGKVKSKCTYEDGKSVKGSCYTYDEFGNLLKQQ